MAFSFSRLIISESDSVACKKAFELVDQMHPKAIQRGTASCVGEIGEYTIWLGFTRMGAPSWRCSCIHSEKPCVHTIALSIAWDRNRGVPDPSQENIDYLTKKH